MFTYIFVIINGNYEIISITQYVVLVTKGLTKTVCSGAIKEHCHIFIIII